MAKPITLITATLVVSLAGGGVALALDKPADGFPDRPLTVIVPYGTGGGSDNVTRAWAPAMEAIIGQPLTVSNMPGGGGLGAIPEFMGATQDGYTIIQHIDMVASYYASGDLPFDPTTEWQPLCATQVTFNQFYVNSEDERFSTWEEFVEVASQERLTVAGVGAAGTSKPVIIDNINEQLGLNLHHVAFDQPTQRFAALVGRQVDALLSQPGDVRGFVEAGEFTPILTIAEEHPDALAHDVPTHYEVGADFPPLLRWRGFFTHPDVPEERRDYLAQACEIAFQDERYQAFNEQNYMHLVDSFRGPEAFAEMIRQDIEVYREALE